MSTTGSSRSKRPASPTSSTRSSARAAKLRGCSTSTARCCRRRVVHEAADARVTLELYLGDRAPFSLIDFFTGAPEEQRDG
jgi:hypothetical protein